MSLRWNLQLKIKLLLLLFISVFFLSSAFAYSFPLSWIRNKTGGSVDLDNDGVIDRAEILLKGNIGQGLSINTSGYLGIEEGKGIITEQGLSLNTSYLEEHWVSLIEKEEEDEGHKGLKTIGGSETEVLLEGNDTYKRYQEMLFQNNDTYNSTGQNVYNLIGHTKCAPISNATLIENETDQTLSGDQYNLDYTTGKINITDLNATAGDIEDVIINYTCNAYVFPVTTTLSPIYTNSVTVETYAGVELIEDTNYTIDYCSGQINITDLNTTAGDNETVEISYKYVSPRTTGGPSFGILNTNYNPLINGSVSLHLRDTTLLVENNDTYNDTGSNVYNIFSYTEEAPIVEGSEIVTESETGTVLKKGVNYTIDYTTGEVNITDLNTTVGDTEDVEISYGYELEKGRCGNYTVLDYQIGRIKLWRFNKTTGTESLNVTYNWTDFKGNYVYWNSSTQSVEANAAQILKLIYNITNETFMGISPPEVIETDYPVKKNSETIYELYNPSNTLTKGENYTVIDYGEGKFNITDWNATTGTEDIGANYTKGSYLPKAGGEMVGNLNLSSNNIKSIFFLKEDPLKINSTELNLSSNYIQNSESINEVSVQGLVGYWPFEDSDNKKGSIITKDWSKYGNDGYYANIVNPHGSTVDFKPGDSILQFGTNARYFNNDTSENPDYNTGDEVFIDDDSDGYYTAQADFLLNGTASEGDLLTGTKPSAWENVTFYNHSATSGWSSSNDAIILENSTTTDYKTYSSQDIILAGNESMVQGATLYTSRPSDWSLVKFNDTTSGGNYDWSTDAIVNDTGGSGTYSTSADTQINAGEDGVFNVTDGDPSKDLDESTYYALDVDDSGDISQGDEVIKKRIKGTLGKVGRALTFDGNDDLAVAHNNSLNTPNALTVAHWVTPNKSYTNEPNDWYLFSRKEGTVWEFGYEGWNDEVGFKPRNSTGGSFSVKDNINFTKGETYFYVGVINTSNDSVKLYRDGESVDSRFDFEGEILQSQGILNFGENWNGTIDEVRIFNRALSEDEVKTLYEKGRKRKQEIGGAWLGRKGGKLYGNLNMNNNNITNFFDVSPPPGNLIQDVNEGGDFETVNIINITEDLYVNEAGDRMNGTLNMTGNNITGLGNINMKNGDITGVDKLKDGGNNFFDNTGNEGDTLTGITSSGDLQFTDIDHSKLVGVKYNQHHGVGTGIKWGSNNDVAFDCSNVKGNHLACGHERDTQNTPDNQLLFPFGDADPDGDSSWSTYYGQNGSIYYLDDDGEFSFENDTDKRCGFSTFIDGSKNQINECSYKPYGLISYWPLDNDNAWDPISGNNGTLEGDLTTGVPGKVRRAFNFSGTNDYVNVSQDPSLDEAFSGSRVTVSMWLKAFSTGPGGWNDYIHVDGEDGNAHRIEEAGGEIDNVNLCLVNSTGDQKCMGENNVVAAGSWNMVTGTYDGSTMKLYINGTLVHTKDESFTLDGIGNDLIIGRGHGPVNCSIDEVRIYNRTLSATEIGRLYNATEPVSGHDPTFGPAFPTEKVHVQNDFLSLSGGTIAGSLDMDGNAISNTYWNQLDIKSSGGSVRIFPRACADDEVCCTATGTYGSVYCEDADYGCGIGWQTDDCTTENDTSWPKTFCGVTLDEPNFRVICPETETNYCLIVDEDGDVWGGSDYFYFWTPSDVPNGFVIKKIEDTSGSPVMFGVNSSSLYLSSKNRIYEEGERAIDTAHSFYIENDTGTAVLSVNQEPDSYYSNMSALGKVAFASPIVDLGGTSDECGDGVYCCPNGSCMSGGC